MGVKSVIINKDLEVKIYKFTDLKQRMPYKS